ncbi:MAG: hypothetical protein Q9187_004174 [Circinaria calcarea]
MQFLILLSLACPFVGFAQAQFQFFEQMFPGQQHQQQHQQPQNVASDSEWYQRTYEAGMTASVMIGRFLIADLMHQPTATTTSVLEHLHASIFHTTVLAPFLPSKTKLNWERVAQSAYQKEAISSGRLRGRSSWHAKL